MTRMDPRVFPELLAAAQAGDEGAFTALFRETQPSVLRYLRAVAGQRADDLAAETWLQVVRGLGRFVGDEPAAFRAWVLAIARHRWLDDKRSLARRPESTVDELPDRPSARDVEHEVAEMITTEAAVDLIGRLAPDQAEVVMLRVVADLDSAAVATLVGKTDGAVRVLLHRGLRRLRDIIAKENLDFGVTPPTRRTVDQRDD